MPPPAGKKDAAAYHTILSDLHRLHALMLNMQTIDDPFSEKSLREHFSREHTVITGRLNEWKLRRRPIYDQAYTDFQQQLISETSTA